MRVVRIGDSAAILEDELLVGVGLFAKECVGNTMGFEPSVFRRDTPAADVHGPSGPADDWTVPALRGMGLRGIA